jgi:hypothetical protein
MAPLPSSRGSPLVLVERPPRETVSLRPVSPPPAPGAAGGPDPHAALLRPREGALDLLGLAVDLEDHPADSLVHVGHADIRHHLEGVPDLVDHRLLDQIRLEGETHAAARHR